MAVRYLNRVSARRQDIGSDVQRGLQSGEQIGKLLSGLGAAIQGAQKNAIANKLMTEQSISDQPGAGVTQDLGQLPGGPQPNAGGNSSGTSGPDPDPDPIQQQPQTFTNPSTGNIEPLQGQAPEYSFQDMPDLSQAANRQQAASSLQANAQPTQPSGGSDFSLSGFGGGGGKGTVGGLLHTGGTAEMELRKEMLAQQIQKAQLARATAPPAPPDPLDAALKRVRLAQAQYNLAHPKGDKPIDLEKNPPPATDLDIEPVLNQAQLEKTVDGTYGKGAYAGMIRTVEEPEKLPDGTPNPNGPLISGDSITLGPKNKRITMPLDQAKILAKQHNSIQFKKGLPLIRVPGENDQTQGATAHNPYPVNSKLDMVSRAHGTWIRLPDKSVRLVP